MLLLSFVTQIKDDFYDSIVKLALSIDMVIYNAAGWMYSVFMSISGAKIFSNELILQFTNRMYMIISVVALFVVTYTFLTIIINPDNLTKGNSSGVKLVTNIIISFVCIILVPTIFQFAYTIQNSVLQSNVLPKLIIGSSSVQQDLSGDFVTSLFESSYFLDNSVDCESASYFTYDTSLTEVQLDYCQADSSARLTGDIGNFMPTASYAASTGGITYNFIISTIIGGFVLYCFIVFCIDIGLRAVKLAFFEMIAPIPILLNIVPGQSKVFIAWIKETVKTFLEVFIKIMIILFGVFMISQVHHAWNEGTIVGFDFGASQSVLNFAKLFIIMGILLFIKQAPGLVGDILGIKLDGNGLSLRKRIDEIKESPLIKGITQGVDKTVGAVGGYVAARKAYNNGIKAGNKGGAVKSALASFHGIRNGMNGGIKGIGNAYSYEMDVQQSYANTRSQSGAKQVMAGIGDSLRDNLGFKSRYDYFTQKAAMSRDYENAYDQQTITNLTVATSKKIASINNGHKAYIDDNQTALDKFKEVSDTAESDLSKKSSTITLSDAELGRHFDSKYNSFKTSYTDASGKTDTYNYYDYLLSEAKMRRDHARAVRKGDAATAAKLSSEITRIQSAMMYHESEYNAFKSRVSGMNWDSLEALRSRTNDDKTLSEVDRRKIINQINAAQDTLKIKYNSDQSLQSSEYKVKKADYENFINLTSTKVGFGSITKKDSSGNYVEDSNGNLIIEDVADATKQRQILLDLAKGDGIFSSKKHLGKIIDNEKYNTNDEMNNSTISNVDYYDETGKKQVATGLKLLQADRIITAAKARTEARNKEYERIAESHESEKRRAESHKHIAEMRKKRPGK